MITAHYKPQAPLSDFIKIFWYWDGYVQPHTRERLLPDGSMTIVFNLGEDCIRANEGKNPDKSQSRSGQVISGPRASPFVVETRDMVTTLGVQFKPGGAFPFLGMPADELAEQCVSLEDVFGNSVGEIREQLLRTSDPKWKFQVLEKWLFDRMTLPFDHHPAIHYALRQLERAPVATTVSSIVDRVGLSQRHFIQLFTAEVGLTPKRFSRVRRFQRVVTSIGTRREVDWAETALCCGYYDQAHFVHDFKEFAGLTPESYLLRRTAHLNHVPLVV